MIPKQFRTPPTKAEQVYMKMLRDRPGQGSLPKICFEIRRIEGEQYKALRERVAKNMQGDNSEIIVGR